MTSGGPWSQRSSLESQSLAASLSSSSLSSLPKPPRPPLPHLHPQHCYDAFKRLDANHNMELDIDDVQDLPNQRDNERTRRMEGKEGEGQGAMGSKSRVGSGVE